MTNSQQPSSNLIEPPQETGPLPEPVTAQTGSPAKFKKNGLAVAALVLGIVAFVGAFIPFFNFVTGIIALVGLILGVVAIFQKRASKPMAIAAAAISFVAIVLSIVMAIAYTAAFAGAVSDSISKPITKSGSSATTGATEGAADAASTDTNATFGQTVTYKDGLAITVSEPVPFTPGQYAAGAEQAANVLFTITVLNGTEKNYEPLLYSTVSSGGTEGEAIFDADNALDGAPTTIIPAGKSVTYKAGFSVADPNKIVFDMSLGFRDHAVFEK